MSFITDSDNILIFLNLLLFRFTLGNTGLRPAAHDRRIQSVSEPGKKSYSLYLRNHSCWLSSERALHNWRLGNTKIQIYSRIFCNKLSRRISEFRKMKLHKNPLRIVGGEIAKIKTYFVYHTHIQYTDTHRLTESVRLIYT